MSLNPPSPETGVVLPQEGERLLIGDIAQLNSDPRVQKALRRLAADKVPETISQLVMWNLAARIDWLVIAQLTSDWVNAQELALARQFVERLDTLPEGESGQLFLEVVAGERQHEALAAELNKWMAGRTILGLKAAPGVPDKPGGPSVGCKLQIVGDPDQPEALIRVAASNGHREWTSMGKFTLAIAAGGDGKRDLAGFGEKLAGGVLERLVRARLVKGRDGLQGTLTYKLQVDNASPLILNGFAVAGTLSKPGEPPHLLVGIALPPQRSVQVPLTAGLVEAYGMKKGTHLVALDLSALLSLD